MEIHKIKDVSDKILNSLDKMMNKSCQGGKYTLVELRDKYSNNMDILYIIEKDEPVYVLLLDIFPKHKSLYLHDVCVGTSHRGKGIFKKSIAFMKKYYSKLGFTNFTLDASDSVKEKGLDQVARIYIFHSAGFNINPETGIFKSTGEYSIFKTNVLLDNGEKVEIQKKVGNKYSVKNKDGKKYNIAIDQIQKCYDNESNQISCPMIMRFKKTKTRKNRSNRG